MVGYLDVRPEGLVRRIVTLVNESSHKNGNKEL